MGKIWLKSVDPNKQCCGCEGKTGPCDSCCPKITIPESQNAFSAGEYANLLRASMVGNATASTTNLIFSTDGSKLTINNPANVTFAPAPSQCILGGSTDNNGAYSILFTIKSGEQLVLTETVLQPGAEQNGPLWFDPASVLDPTRCNPRIIPGVTPSQVGVYRLQSASTSIIINGNQGVNGQDQIQYVLLPTVLNSTNTAGVSVVRGLNQFSGAVFGCQIAEASYATAQYRYSNTLVSSYSVANSTTNSTITFATSSAIDESLRFSPPCDLIQMTSDRPIGIGEVVSRTIAITGIQKVVRPNGQGFSVGYTSTACVEATLRNLASIQLLDVNGNPISLRSRLRRYAVS